MQTSISAFNQTLEKSNAWLKALQVSGDFQSEEEAYTALRSVLHSLRDRLLVNESADLAAQLPLLIRGVYYEGWVPAAVPHKEITKTEFLQCVSNNLGNAINRIEPEKATTAVFQFLSKNISEGQINDVKSELPAEILSLWN
jgi:uncharacterized protein (DUF2267 family)